MRDKNYTTPGQTLRPQPTSVPHRLRPESTAFIFAFCRFCCFESFLKDATARCLADNPLSNLFFETFPPLVFRTVAVAVSPHFADSMLVCRAAFAAFTISSSYTASDEFPVPSDELAPRKFFNVTFGAAAARASASCTEVCRCLSLSVSVTVDIRCTRSSLLNLARAECPIVFANNAPPRRRHLKAHVSPKRTLRCLGNERQTS